MDYICKNCGHQGQTTKITKSSFATEVSLWAIIFILAAFSTIWLLLLPLGFTIWRAASSYNGCGLCKSDSIIPVDSPAGKKLSESTSLNNNEDRAEK